MNLDKLFPFLGIRGKLLVVFVGLGIGPLGVVGVYTVHSTSRALVTANANHLSRQLEANVGHIESYLALLATNVNVVGERVSSSRIFDGRDANAARAQVEDFFVELARMRPDYYQIRLLGSDGHELVRVNRHGDQLDRVPISGLQDKSDRYYLKAGMAAVGDETYFSPMDLNVEHGEPEQPHQLVFRVGRQVHDGRGRARGLVVINVFAHEMLDRLKPLRPGQLGEVLLIDEDGRFVREICAGDACEYEFGQARSYLAAFPPSEIDALIAGRSAAMAQGGTRLLSYSPIRVGGPSGGRRWRLAIVHPKDSILAPVQRMRHLFYLFGTLVAIGAFVLAALATRALVRPIHTILAFVEGIATGDFRRELHVETRDEIEQLGRGVQSMAKSLEEARLQLVRWNEGLQAEVDRKVAEVGSLLETKQLIERQLRHADKLASLGLLSASLAHEIGNPLASIKTAIQVNLQRTQIAGPAREVIEAILKEVDRLGRVLQRMTGFVRPAQDQPVEVAPGEIYRQVVVLLDREARRKGIAMRLEGHAAERTVVIDTQRLEQVLFNLMSNAVQAMQEPGALTVEVSARDSVLEITVKDTGPGIPADLREQVFDPFVTTKQDGTGLGLAIVRQLVQEMHGEVRLEFPDSGGTLARLQLPSGAKSAAV